MTAVVVGFDFGTTHLKWQARNPDGQTVGGGQERCPMVSDGWQAELDPDWVVDTVQRLLHQLAREHEVQAVGLSAALHSFLVVDETGRPLTRCWTWMDRRAWAEAQALRQEFGQLFVPEVGVPIHAMSPWVKWIAWTRHRGSVPPGARPVSLKDYVIYRLTGRWVTDFSTAAGSGFLDVHGRWSARALERAGLPVGALGDVRAVTTVVRGGPGLSIVVGGSDAAMGHAGLKVRPDDRRAVLALGTSGALRVSAREPKGLGTPLFVFLTGPAEGYLVGAAFSNAGNVLSWWAELFEQPLTAWLDRGIAAVSSGSSLPVLLPYFFGERFPLWDERLTAGIAGLTASHSVNELAGASVVALVGQYREALLLLDRLSPIDEVLAGSGLIEHAPLAQLMADALQKPVRVMTQGDASLEGAVELARQAVGWPQREQQFPSLCYQPTQRPRLRERLDAWRAARPLNGD